VSDRRFDVTAVGETMLRLSVPPGERLEAAARLHTAAGGAESNVLGALAALGRRVGFVAGLPDNALGRLVARELRAAGVDVSGIVWDAGGRLGTYFVEHAPDPGPRPSRVVYDRAGSCGAALGAGSVDWDHVSDTRILHLTGITPALSPTSRELVRALVRRAREACLPVSFDVNHRAQLWSADEAGSELAALLAGVELLFCSARDAEQIFGLEKAPAAVAAALAERTGARAVVVSQGVAGATLWSSATGALTAAAPAVRMVDRLGAGDALAAGVIDGWLDGDLELGLRRGVALSALALTQRGDIVITSRSELDEALVPSAPGVQR
jgi:2-dehydro-3-deoxygluconokinase